MDSFYSNSTSHDLRNLKLKGLSMTGNRDSALIEYLRSGSPSAGGGDSITSPASKYQYQYGSGVIRSPLSSVENMVRSPVLGPPLKVEEDVLVMDAILVGSVPGERSTARSGSDSGGLGSSGKSMYKKETCRAWEDSSRCRFGPKCQFAHGKEELCPSRFLQKNKPEFAHGKEQLCPSRFLNKNKPEAHMEKSTSSGSESRPAAIPYGPARAATVAMKLEARDSDAIIRNWSPFDDGIEIGMPMPASSTDHKPSSRENFDAVIVSVFGGPSTKKRLPVFVQICPE